MLARKYVTLAEVLQLSQRKFGADFNDRLFLGQLASLEDIPDQKIDFLDTPVTRTKIQTALRDEIKNILNP